ncbi:MAG: hypothetical protein AAGF11_00045 [Myxococcota bacterium]
MKRSLFIVCVLLGACNAETSADASTQDCAPPAESLRWKRADVLVNDLAGSLELEQATICTELGTTPCREVHGISLGASEPFLNTLYEPLPRPMVTTALAIDRVMLSACRRGVERDQRVASDERVVFTHIELGAASLDPADAGVKAQVHELYQRLLGRDATDDEVAMVAELATDDVSAETFATLACFSIATTTEFLFY